MKGDRLPRVNKTLRTALAQMVPRLVRNPAVHLMDTVTVTEVRSSKDLRHAKVYVALQGDEQSKTPALRGLQKASAFLRSELGRTVKLRYTPELQFLLDNTLKSAEKIDTVLAEIAKEDATRSREHSMLAVCEALKDAHRILIATHRHPDGDAIGSLVAAHLGLKAMGKEVYAWCDEEIPEKLRFVAESTDVVQHIPAGSFDVTLVLDCGDLALTSGLEEGNEKLGKFVVIDHHATSVEFGQVVLRDPKAASVGFLLYEIFERLETELNPAIANAIYCSLVSDTGSFRYQNTNAAAFDCAARLMEYGVDPWHVASNIYERRPVGALRLLAKSLGTLQISDDGLMAAICVTEKMLKDTACAPDVVDGFINYARGIDGVEVAVLFRPSERGLRVSMRSRGDVDVSTIAEQLGGGGHRNAAGFTFEGKSEIAFGLLAEKTRQAAIAGGLVPESK